MTKRIAPVSALMAVYNHQSFIREAIESVRAQTLPVAELIVVDDGSADDSVSIAKSMGARVIRQSNAGIPRTRNRCIHESTQPWIAFIDADDIWEPEKIERQMEIANSNPDVALVTSDFTRFDRSGAIVASGLEKYRDGYQAQPKRACEHGSIIDELDERFSDVAYFVVPSYVMVRRDVLDVTGWFDEKLNAAAEDFDCFMRVLAKHPMGVVERVLVRRREHETNAGLHYVKTTLSCLAATYKVLENPHLYPSAIVELCKKWLPSNLRHAGARQLWDGNPKAGRELLFESARLELSPRTVMALGCSFTPSIIARNLMAFRYHVSKTVGI